MAGITVVVGAVTSLGGAWESRVKALRQTLSSAESASLVRSVQVTPSGLTKLSPGAAVAPLEYPSMHVSRGMGAS